MSLRVNGSSVSRSRQHFALTHSSSIAARQKTFPVVLIATMCVLSVNVFKDRRSPRRRGRMGTSVRRERTDWIGSDRIRFGSSAERLDGRRARDSLRNGVHHANGVVWEPHRTLVLARVVFVKRELRELLKLQRLARHRMLLMLLHVRHRVHDVHDRAVVRAHRVFERQERHRAAVERKASERYPLSRAIFEAAPLLAPLRRGDVAAVLRHRLLPHGARWGREGRREGKRAGGWEGGWGGSVGRVHATRARGTDWRDLRSRGSARADATPTPARAGQLF
eukprot:31204-Pelagococcus_subviridis.AAC.5